MAWQGKAENSNFKWSPGFFLYDYSHSRAKLQQNRKLVFPSVQFSWTDKDSGFCQWEAKIRENTQSGGLTYGFGSNFGTRMDGCAHRWHTCLTGKVFGWVFLEQNQPENGNRVWTYIQPKAADRIVVSVAVVGIRGMSFTLMGHLAFNCWHWLLCGLCRITITEGNHRIDFAGAYLMKTWKLWYCKC